MGLDMLLQVLGALEGFATEVAFVRLQRHMHANVRSDMIALDSSRAARAPLAGKVEVVGALATDMSFAYVVLFARVEVSSTPSEEGLATTSHLLT